MSMFSSTSERGVAMVEFSVILPLLLMIFLGIAELGRALLFYQRLTEVVETGARYAARANGAVDDTDCSALTSWPSVIADTENVVIFGRVAGGSPPVVPGLDSADPAVADVEVNLVSRAVTGVGDVCVVQVVARVKYTGIFGTQLIPLLGIAQPTLTAQSEERYVGE